MITEPEKLVGRRFGADFRVAEIAPGAPEDEERAVTLWMHGERFELSLGELSTLIERGFVAEMPEVGR